MARSTSKSRAAAATCSTPRDFRLVVAAQPRTPVPRERIELTISKTDPSDIRRDRHRRRRRRLISK